MCVCVCVCVCYGVIIIQVLHGDMYADIQGDIYAYCKFYICSALNIDFENKCFLMKDSIYNC